MKKGFDELKNFLFTHVVNEKKKKFPLFMQILCAFSINPASCNHQKIEETIPCWALVYGILMQGNFSELSYVQHVLSAIREESLCDNKISLCGIF